MRELRAQAVIETAANPTDMLHRSLWQRMMVACAVIIAFDPFRLFEQQLLQQVPGTLVISYLMFSVLRRPLAPLRSVTATIFVAMVLWALPGIIYNKMSEDTGMFTAIIMFLIPISAAYAVGRCTTIDGVAMLKHAQWIGIAYLLGSLLRLAADRHSELLWYGIHERSFLLGFIFVPAFLMRRYRVFALTLAASCILLFLDFRATTAFCLMNSLIIAMFSRYRVSSIFVYSYMIGIFVFLLTAYMGFDIVWALYAFVKGIHSQSINDEVRRATIVLAFDEWAKMPMFGDFFCGRGAYDLRPYVAWWQEGLVPLHNDYLDFLVRGGIFGLSMLLAGLASALLITLRSMKSMARQGRDDLVMWNTFLMTALVNILFVISFNPVLKTVSHGFVAQLVLAWIIALHLVVKNGDVRDWSAVARGVWTAEHVGDMTDVMLGERRTSGLGRG
jgi:hypothetical protein